MKKEWYEKIMSKLLSYDCDFIEIYYEEAKKKNYILIDKKLDDIVSSNTKGIGIRIINEGKVYYASTNDIGEESVLSLATNLFIQAHCPKKEEVFFQLPKEKKIEPKIKIEHDDYPIEKKIQILKEIDQTSRNYSPLISQVKAGFYETDKKYTIVNSDKKYISSKEVSTRLICMPYASKEGKMEYSFTSYGKGMGYELLDHFDIQNFALSQAKIAVDKLSAKKFKGGKVPVIIGSGFGAVIFHEACVHSLEATSVADGLSVFSNKLGEKIASSKVTIIDDGTIKGEWGTTKIDSEGNKTQKNILIKNGVLKSYLVDYANAKKMHHPLTGSGRRESYLYAPTSRMNNTYLDKGKDKIEDMIKSIDYGIYCKSLSGGSVEVKTGDFNFSAGESYLIENGKITDMITGITLIGKGQDIIQKVEMVSDDLKIETGYCGSASGIVLVTVGQPTIKVSEILVGGEG